MERTATSLNSDIGFIFGEDSVNLALKAAKSVKILDEKSPFWSQIHRNKHKDFLP